MRIVRMPPPRARQGQVCNKVGRILGNDAEENDLGHVLSNDSGVITERGSDTVRGADIAFYSSTKVPRGLLSECALDVPPDLIIQVLSPDDDPDRRTLTLFGGDQPVRVLSEKDELTLPTLFGELRALIRRFFD
jgi:Uma2 family endonuclease